MGSAAVVPFAGQYSQVSTPQGLATAPSLSRQQVSPDACRGTTSYEPEYLSARVLMAELPNAEYPSAIGAYRVNIDHALPFPYYITKRRIGVRENLSG